VRNTVNKYCFAVFSKPIMFADFLACFFDIGIDLGMNIMFLRFFFISVFVYSL